MIVQTYMLLTVRLDKTLGHPRRCVLLDLNRNTPPSLERHFHEATRGFKTHEQTRERQIMSYFRMRIEAERPQTTVHAQPTREADI
jgi:hypothetical protein